MEEEADIRALKFRICNIIKVWVDEYFEDIRDSPSLFPLLITFVLGKLIREGRGTLANIIKASIYNKVFLNSHSRFTQGMNMYTICVIVPPETSIQAEAAQYFRYPRRKQPLSTQTQGDQFILGFFLFGRTNPFCTRQLGKLSLASPRLSITDISEEEAARQLTLIEHSAVGKIKVA